MAELKKAGCRNQFVEITKSLSNYNARQLCHYYRNYLDPEVCQEALDDKEKIFIERWILTNKAKGNGVIEWKKLRQDLKNKSGRFRSENKLKNFWYSKQRRDKKDTTTSSSRKSRTSRTSNTTNFTPTSPETPIFNHSCEPGIVAQSHLSSPITYTSPIEPDIVTENHSSSPTTYFHSLEHNIITQNHSIVAQNHISLPATYARPNIIMRNHSSSSTTHTRSFEQNHLSLPATCTRPFEYHTNNLRLPTLESFLKQKNQQQSISLLPTLELSFKQKNQQQSISLLPTLEPSLKRQDPELPYNI